MLLKISTFLLFDLKSIYIGDSSSQISRREIWYNNLIAGAVAGAVSRTCTAPFDRLKTVMQALGSRIEIRIVGGFQHLIAEGGIMGLWRGNGINYHIKFSFKYVMVTFNYFLRN